MRKKLKIIIPLIFFLLLGYALWKHFDAMLKEKASYVSPLSSGHDHDHEHEEENFVHMSESQIKDLGIEIQKAVSGELSVTISTRGKIMLHPDLLVHVLPKISGVAKDAFKNIGDSVKAGDMIATLESREMADTKANYLTAKEKLSLTSSLLMREKRLFEKKVSAEQDYLNAKSVYEEAKINAQLATQKLRAFGVSDKEIEELSHKNYQDLRLYEIRSPINGTVIARHFTIGEFVENGVTIYEIADLSTIWIEIGIYPKDLIKVQKGQLVDIYLPDGEVFAAEIIYLSPIIQDETITAKAIAEIKNPNENWRPGSFVKVNIATEKVSVPVVISKDAYQEIDGKDFIFVKVADGFEKRQVQLGVSNDTNVEVLSGLSEGEEYAASKTFLLKADLTKHEAEHEHG